ncbi:hypothetical protein ACJIZ3_019264 [Penstemon smallii]|uniref:Bifunctional inhibitor/plant lipid transfer protein/seed storage helical domain-containing protein n=1 Tax=Penstemon smallii TaxID=265156 RepID=A0ABD3T0P2_9LAMI
MMNFLTIKCTLVTLALVAMSGGAHIATSQAPVGAPEVQTVDCSTLINNMMDCMSYLGNGGDEKEPDYSCCSGLETLVNTNPDCMCYALSTSASLGLDINMTKAENLPSACGVSAPSISKCNLSNTPGTSPPANPPPAVRSPKLAPTKPPVASHRLAPAPSPKSGAYSATSSTFLLVFLMFVSFFTALKYLS